MRQYTQSKILFQIHIYKEKDYYPQRAQRAWGIVRDWQIFGYGSDFPTWSEVGTKSKAKVPNFGGNFEPSYLWTRKSF